MSTGIHPALAQGKVAVITGGASGIGLATAEHLCRAGLRVCIADQDEEALESAAHHLANVGEVMPQHTDVSNSASMDTLANRVADELGPVSVLMNNAGVGGGGDAISNPEGWERVLGVNLFGVLHGVQRFVPDMVASEGPGLVINTGSKQGITQPPGDTAYNVSKSGIKSLTEGLAHTLLQKTQGRVTAHLLVPGFTYTGMIKRFVTEKPAAAWEAAQVVEFLFKSLARRDFYILCPDHDVTRAIDEKRILWNTYDIIENRPALSRWNPEYEDEFEAFMKR
ncbi:MAG: SDR family NAD(P)-dependent oxidoreductase [Myxococcota bacterium]|nr:SDR family NAD(P)-dependent oxidoreductase [Myxococcota bacterium]